MERLLSFQHASYSKFLLSHSKHVKFITSIGKRFQALPSSIKFTNSANVFQALLKQGLSDESFFQLNKRGMLLTYCTYINSTTNKTFFKSRSGS
jgi:hypothetical protein